MRISRQDPGLKHATGFIAIPSRIGIASLILWVALEAAGIATGLWKLAGISAIAFAALAGGATLGALSGRGRSQHVMAWGSGLASGAMITSACIFLLPTAIRSQPAAGSYGLALGMFAGFLVHLASGFMGDRMRYGDSATVKLTLHALAAGTVIGLVYAGMPKLGLALGVAIVSHKAPAGYAAARQLSKTGGAVSQLLLPASAVGLAALPVGLIHPAGSPVATGLIFGFATGIFLHVAMDFLPARESGDQSDSTWRQRSRLEMGAAPLLGGLLVFLAWLCLT